MPNATLTQAPSMLSPAKRVLSRKLTVITMTIGAIQAARAACWALETDRPAAPPGVNPVDGGSPGGAAVLMRVSLTVTTISDSFQR